MGIQALFYPQERSTAPEIMDDPGSDPELLERTLGQLVLVNRLLSRMRGLLRRHLLRDMAERGEPGRTWSVLDVGAGGCDIPIWLVRVAHRRGIALNITCLDHDPRVLQYARSRVAEYPEITLLEGSAFAIPGSYDYIICNHFLHHLTDDEIGRFLAAAHRACRRRLLVNDLLRSYWSLAGFQLFATLFLRGSFARSDGLLSIRKGFRRRELSRIIAGSPWGAPETERIIGHALPGRLYCVATQRM